MRSLRVGPVPVNVLILRDPKESRAKCSLTPLRGLPGIRFVEYRRDRRLDAGGHLLLDPEGEPIGPEDRGKDLFLIDCSWRRLGTLRRSVDGEPVRRRLPKLITAYPRKSRTFADPDQGLASVEALFAAVLALGERRDELLVGYRWSEAFLRANADALARIESGEG